MQWWKDIQFLVALVIGPVFWLAFWIITSRTLDLAWPLRQPLIFLLPVVAYPVVEEIVFRRLLQGRLLRPRLGHIQYGRISAPNLIASAIFAASHLLNQPGIWALMVIFPSLIFGYFYDRYSRLAPVIVLHIFYNAGFFWFFV